jgi:hypothetical protein
MRKAMIEDPGFVQQRSDDLAFFGFAAPGGASSGFAALCYQAALAQEQARRSWRSRLRERIALRLAPWLEPE